MRRWGVLLAAAAVLSCTGPASRKVEPIATPEASDTCPGGRQSWALDVVDHRAERDRVDTERMRTILTDSIKGSFPGCRWEGAASGEPVIRIEVWQFRSTFLDGLWEARASWTVEVGHDSRFEVEEGVSRPRYQGSDNEAQSLRDVFAAAMQKTNDGLRAVPSR
ncbi:MAG TPA: hypothetical protein VIA29_05620 [Thermoanaerobaculia bacterium]